MKDVFFYGLFMDVNILAKNGVHPSNARTGYLRDYTLKIGNRASLIPSPGERAYGVIMSVDETELDVLYAEPSVADYHPEEVSIVTDSNEVVKAACYNLPLEALSGTNTAYAQSLHELAQRLGFPSDYLERIKDMV